jgi:hypothetical protein
MSEISDSRANENLPAQLQGETVSSVLGSVMSYKQRYNDASVYQRGQRREAIRRLTELQQTMELVLAAYDTRLNPAQQKLMKMPDSGPNILESLFTHTLGTLFRSTANRVEATINWFDGALLPMFLIAVLFASVGALVFGIISSQPSAMQHRERAQAERILTDPLNQLSAYYRTNHSFINLTAADIGMKALPGGSYVQKPIANSVYLLDSVDNVILCASGGGEGFCLKYDNNGKVSYSSSEQNSNVNSNAPVGTLARAGSFDSTESDVW